MTKKKKTTRKKKPIRNVHRHTSSSLSNRILLSLKREFTKSETVNNFKNSKKIYVHRYKKNGDRHKVDSVYYACDCCGKSDLKDADVQVDHIEPVIPVNIPTEHVCWNDIIEKRLFVSEDKLQLLCKPCHKEKTKEENRLRREWKKKTKHIVFKTVCTKTGTHVFGRYKCDDYNDNYIGGAYQIPNAFYKYDDTITKDDFIRYVLFCYDNKEEAVEKLYELRNPEGYVNLKNKKFGKLTVLTRSGVNDTGKQSWNCICDCDKKCTVIQDYLIEGVKDSCGCESRPLKYNKKVVLKAVYSNYQSSAIRRGYDFNLTTEDVENLIFNKCHYCENEPMNQFTSIIRDGTVCDYLYNGIDRKDNDIGYNLTNCVSCCKICNIMKMELSYEDFLSQIKTIHDNMLKRTKEKK